MTSSRAPFGFSDVGFAGEERAFLSPSVDVTESDEAIEVSAEIPGVEEDDVEVTLTDGALVIKGEKKSEHVTKDKTRHAVERAYGSFQRMIPVPYDVDPERVDASFKKGVLKVRLPKPPEAKASAKKIAIKGGS